MKVKMIILDCGLTIPLNNFGNEFLADFGAVMDELKYDKLCKGKDKSKITFTPELIRKDDLGTGAFFVLKFALDYSKGKTFWQLIKSGTMEDLDEDLIVWLEENDKRNQRLNPGYFIHRKVKLKVSESLNEYMSELSKSKEEFEASGTLPEGWSISYAFEKR